MLGSSVPFLGQFLCHIACGGFLVFQAVQLGAGGLHGRLQPRTPHLQGSGILLHAGHGGAHDLPPLTALQRLLFQRVQLLAQLVRLGIQILQHGLQLGDFRFVLVRFLSNPLCAFPGARQLIAGAADLLVCVFGFVLQNCQLAFTPGVLLGNGADLSVRFLHLQHQLLGFGAQGFGASVKFIQLAGNACIVAFRRLILALLVPHRILCAADGIHPQGNFQPLAGLGIRQELLRLFTVAFQGSNPLFQLAQDIPQAFQIALRRGQAAFGFIFAVAVFSNAGCFLKNLAPLGGFCTNDLRNAPLTHNGVAIAPKAGIQQQLVHIF